MLSSVAFFVFFLAVPSRGDNSAAMKCGSIVDLSTLKDENVEHFRIVSRGRREPRDRGGRRGFSNWYNCEFALKLGSRCEEMSVECSRTGIRGVNGWSCLTFEEEGTQKKFCGSKDISVTSRSSKMRVVFQAARYSSSGWRGFDCKATCTKQSEEATTMVVQSGKSCECGQSTVHTHRIVGGTETAVNEFPWIAGIVKKDEGSEHRYKPFCGGTVISSEYVLTAAHCMESVTASEVEVLLGEHDYTNPDESDEIRVAVEDITIHPQFDIFTVDFDFALMRLAEPLDFHERDNVRPICLPRESVANPEIGAKVIVSGWGTTKEYGEQSEFLQMAKIEVIDTTLCEDWFYHDLTDQQFCAGKEEGSVDACQGDSGGPLVYHRDHRFELVGVTSWGYGCAEEKSPGVYANTSVILGWIRNNTGGNIGCPREPRSLS